MIGNAGLAAVVTLAALCGVLAGLELGRVLGPCAAQGVRAGGPERRPAPGTRSSWVGARRTQPETHGGQELPGGHCQAVRGRSAPEPIM